MSENKNNSHELEERYREQIESVIQEKKDMEQDLYAAKETVDTLGDKLLQARKINTNLLRERDSLLDAPVWRFLIDKYKRRKELKKIEARGVEYWRPIFDAEYYAEEYADVKTALGTDENILLKHFIEHGIYEGRRGNDEFDINRYMELNEDVVEEFFGDNKAACMHYIEKGMYEKRRK